MSKTNPVRVFLHTKLMKDPNFRVSVFKSPQYARREETLQDLFFWRVSDDNRISIVIEIDLESFKIETTWLTATIHKWRRVASSVGKCPGVVVGRQGEGEGRGVSQGNLSHSWRTNFLSYFGFRIAEHTISSQSVRQLDCSRIVDKSHAGGGGRGRKENEVLWLVKLVLMY